jgi:hypothetical protein
VRSHVRETEQRARYIDDYSQVRSDDDDDRWLLSNINKESERIPTASRRTSEPKHGKASESAP